MSVSLLHYEVLNEPSHLLFILMFMISILRDQYIVDCKYMLNIYIVSHSVVFDPLLPHGL